MKNESQTRILYLLRYLYLHTDEEHPASVAEILDLWKEQGIVSDRRVVYRDIALLTELGVDIVCVKSSRNSYFLATRQFELPEVKLLVDAIESSRFITSPCIYGWHCKAEQRNDLLHRGRTPHRHP